MKKQILSMVAVASLGFGSVGVLAYSGETPANTYSELMGLTKEEAQLQRKESGKSYGTLAKENGVYEEFSAQMKKNKEEIINEKVRNGELSEADANKYLQQMEDNCDGSGESKKSGQELGLKLGRGNGDEQALKQRRGNGDNQDQKQGNGKGQGDCLSTE